MTEVTDRPVRVAVEGDGAAEPTGVPDPSNGPTPARAARGRAGRRGGGAVATAAATAATASLQGRLEHLRAATVAELERRQDAAGLEPADSLPVPVRRLSAVERDLPNGAREASRIAAHAAAAILGGGLGGPARGLAGFVARQRELASRTARGEDVTDDFGFDREWTETLLPFFRFLYQQYWRVQTEGLENIPDTGRALLVSNHAGVLPYDGAMIRMAVFDEHPAHRHARALILNAFFGVPLASWFLRRTGNTLAHPDDAERLLDLDELVLVFPEGAKGTGKLYRDRYRLRRFGRGGFVSVAVRTGAPIIPVSIVGSEEIHPMLADLTPVAAALGLPYFPITPTFPLLGPLGLVPTPSSWRIRFHEPIRLDGLDPEAADDASLVMRIGDRVRNTIQDGLYEMLEERGSVFAPAPS